MKSVGVIALNTFREGIRNKMMYSLVFFALVLIIFSYFLGEVSIGERIKVMQDMGLSTISIFGVLIAIFVGIGLVYKEVDKKTIYTIISKPIQRYQFLLGKFFGLSLMLAVQMSLMTMFFYLTLYVSSGFFNADLLKAVMLIYMELLVITSVALFFSSFSSPFLSALFCIGLFMIGRSTDDIYELGLKSKNAVFTAVTKVLNYYNLDHFNIIGKVVHGVNVGWGWIFEVLIYGTFIVVIFLSLAAVIFERKDFK